MPRINPEILQGMAAIVAVKMRQNWNMMPSIDWGQVWEYGRWDKK